MPRRPSAPLLAVCHIAAVLLWVVCPVWTFCDATYPPLSWGYTVLWVANRPAEVLVWLSIIACLVADITLVLRLIRARRVAA